MLDQSSSILSLRIALLKKVDRRPKSKLTPNRTLKARPSLRGSSTSRSSGVAAGLGQGGLTDCLGLRKFDKYCHYPETRSKSTQSSRNSAGQWADSGWIGEKLTKLESAGVPRNNLYDLTFLFRLFYTMTGPLIYILSGSVFNYPA